MPVGSVPLGVGSSKVPAVSATLAVDTVDTFGLVAVGISLNCVALRLISERCVSASSSLASLDTSDSPTHWYWYL